MRCTASFAGCVLSLVAAPLCGEEVISADSGSRVRVAAESLINQQERSIELREKVVGILLQVDEDALTLQLDRTEEVVRVPRTSITKLEVSTGKRSKGRRALVGAALGAGTLAAVFALLESNRDYAPCPYGDSLSCGIYAIGSPDPGLAALGGVLIGAPVGALVGAATGGGDRWQEVPMQSPRAVIRIGPERGGGVAASLSIAF